MQISQRSLQQKDGTDIRVRLISRKLRIFSHHQLHTYITRSISVLVPPLRRHLSSLCTSKKSYINRLEARTLADWVSFSRDDRSPGVIKIKNRPRTPRQLRGRKIADSAYISTV
jgi:hypothetical protein